MKLSPLSDNVVELSFLGVEILWNFHLESETLVYQLSWPSKFMSVNFDKSVKTPFKNACIQTHTLGFGQ